MLHSVFQVCSRDSGVTGIGGQDRAVPLTLARSEAFGTGVVHLIYNAADGA